MAKGKRAKRRKSAATPKQNKKRDFITRRKEKSRKSFSSRPRPPLASLSLSHKPNSCLSKLLLQLILLSWERKKKKDIFSNHPVKLASRPYNKYAITSYCNYKSPAWGETFSVISFLASGRFFFQEQPRLTVL